jgi:hypothetical protein
MKHIHMVNVCLVSPLLATGYCYSGLLLLVDTHTNTHDQSNAKETGRRCCRSVCNIIFSSFTVT